MKQPIFKQDSGFTLVEVLVAISILLIVAAAMAGLFTGSFQGVVSSGERSEALFELQKQAEQDLASADIGSDIIKIEFVDVSISGRQGTLRRSFSNGKEVVINVFIPD